MKTKILLYLVIGFLGFFGAGCSEDDYIDPGLKGLESFVAVRTNEGIICSWKKIDNQYSIYIQVKENDLDWKDLFTSFSAKSNSFTQTIEQIEALGIDFSAQICFRARVEVGGKASDWAKTCVAKAENTAPVIELIGDKSISLGSTLAPIAISATDVEGEVALSLEQDNPGVVNCLLDGNEIKSGISTGIGVNKVTVIATDVEGLQASTSFSVRVYNSPPDIQPIDDKSIAIGSILSSVDIFASDAEGSVILSLEQSNQSIVNCQLFGSTIKFDQAAKVGVNNVTITATDEQGEFNSIQFAITVTNTPPSLDHLPDHFIHLGEMIVPQNFKPFDAEGIDRVELVQNNADVVDCYIMNGSEVHSHFSQKTGSSLVNILLYDTAGAKAESSFTVTVVNDPPVIQPIADRSIRVGSILPEFNVVASDDQGVVDLALSQDNASAVNCQLNGGTVQFDQAAKAGINNVAITATDKYGLSASVFFKITVLNDPPVIQPIANRVILVAETLSPISVAASDPEGAVALSLSQSNSTVVNCFLAGSTIQSDPAAIVGTNLLTVTATDEQGLTASTSFTVEVANSPPTIDPITDQIIEAGDPISTITLTGQDREGPITFSIASQTNTNAVNCLLSGELLSSDPAASVGASIITILATDEHGATDSTSFTITVESPDNYAPAVDIPDQNFVIGDSMSIDLPAYVSDQEDAFGDLSIVFNAQTNAGAIDVYLSGDQLLADEAICAGENDVTISVADTGGKTTVHTFKITVEPPAIAYRVYGINFSPYMSGQDPNKQSQISSTQIRQRLWVIARYTDWVRSFGVTDGLERIGEIAHELGLNTVIGAWLSKDLVMNDIQLNKLIELAQAGHVDMAVVGSEVLLRGDLTEAQLLAYINRFKAEAPGVPVVYGDVYGELIAHPDVMAACDVIFANFYSYWEGIHINLAMSNMNTAYESLAAVANGKEIMISEAGWPSAGDTIIDAVPSEANTAFHFLNFHSWAKANSVKTFYFEAFDEDWKAAYEGPQGAHWGIWYEDGVMKPGMQDVFNNRTLPDNWTCDTIPGDPNLPPEIVITSTSDGYARGYAYNVHSSLYCVALYIRVGTGWWTKPYWDYPKTGIQCGGYWVGDIVTGGNDSSANQVAAFLIPYNYFPPKCGGQTGLPQALYDNALDFMIVAK